MGLVLTGMEDGGIVGMDLTQGPEPLIFDNPQISDIYLGQQCLTYLSTIDDDCDDHNENDI